MYQGRFRDGGDVIFWLLEHQSTEDWWMLERVLDTKRMMWRRWRQQHPEARHLPVIVPVVVYNGRRPWRAPRDMHALYGLSEEVRAALGPHVLSCSLIIDDLCAVDDEALRARRMDAYARLCLLAMARAAAEDFLDRLQAWQFELRLVFGSGGEKRFLTFLLYTSRVHRHHDSSTIRKRALDEWNPEEETAEEYFHRLTVEMANDIAGVEAQRAMFLRLLGRRFGAVPEPTAARVAKATRPEVERWFDRAVDAASIDDVFRDE